MSALADKKGSGVVSNELQLATFYVGDMLLGLKIDQVQEINRRLDVTVVPHAPERVCGVINLRGEVVTVIDLRSALGLEVVPPSRDSRNLIVNFHGELVGLCVDRIADILTIPIDDIDATPSNVAAVDHRHFHGVYSMPQEIVIILNLETVLDFS